MADSKVENYKIDPKLKAQVKKYKDVTKVTLALRRGLMIQQSKLQQMAKVLYGTERIRDKMLEMMQPEDRTIDQDGPNPQFEINY